MISWCPWRAFTDRSTDGGQTWTPSADILVPEGLYENGVIQPTLWESEPGQVHMLLRSRHAYMKYTAEKAYNAPRSRIFRADSTDGGRTWGVPYPLKLPNPNSGIDLVKLPHSGTLVLVHNPGFIGRSPLRMSISHDNGVTWPMGYDMVREPGEFSYPSIISWPDHWQSEGVSVIFTWNRRSMAFFRISLEELERRANETNYLPDEAFVYPYEGEQIPMKKGPKGDLRIDHSKFDKFHKTHAAHKDL
uniref:Sialidase domain-containing protein n=1 Tax=Pyramimonas obovata TaxID=1411642 RepID=A0A7S0N7M7_9CHLO